MMERIKFLLVFIFLVLCTFGHSQEVLTLKDAISLAVKNNFNILIAQNNAIIDETNNTKGNAGMLPDLSLNFGRSNNLNNTKQEFFSGDVREGSGVNTNNLNANLLLNWTLFDGMAMFINRDRLLEMEEMGKLNVKIQIENTIGLVMLAYYNIEQNKRRIEIIEKAIEISKERHALATLKKNIGTGTGLEILQAEVDINADSTALIRQIQVLKSSMIQLNTVMGRSPENAFSTVEEKTEKTNFDYGILLQKSMERNQQLKLADKNTSLASLRIRQLEASQYPSLDLNAGYNFTRFVAEIGVLKFNQNRGFSLGLTGRWNIYGGGNNKREIQVARLNMETTKLNKDQTILNLSSDLYESYNDYVTSSELIKMEEKNILIAKQNLDITTDKMRLGTIPSLELRQAQLNLVDAEFRKISAEFEARVSALDLMRLSGGLMN